jgi:hypothetical protein
MEDGLNAGTSDQCMFLVRVQRLVVLGYVHGQTEPDPYACGLLADIDSRLMLVRRVCSTAFSV